MYYNSYESIRIKYSRFYTKILSFSTSLTFTIDHYRYLQIFIDFYRPIQ